VPRWQTFFQSPLKLVPKVKVSCLNLNEVEGWEAPNNSFRPEITGSIEFKRAFGFHSGEWVKQKQQVVSEMRAVNGDHKLAQKEKADFGKQQMERINTAFEEAHRPDVTEERVVFARCKLNLAPFGGGKPSTGASSVLDVPVQGGLAQGMDTHKAYAYHQVSEPVADGISSLRYQPSDGRRTVWSTPVCGACCRWEMQRQATTTTT
jgi:hypothetical protein